MRFETPTPPEGHNNISEQQKPIERVQLDDSPFLFDPKRATEEFFPECKHLKIANGNEYILDENGRTILLFEDKQEGGFTSIYTSLTPSELKTQLSRLPEEDKNKFFELFGITEDTAVIAQTQKVLERRMFPRFQVEKGRSDLKVEAKKNETGTEDLPESHFLTLPEEELRERKKAQWEAVKDLDDNDPKKIVYFRRFTGEFRSKAYFNPKLTAQSGDNFEYYVPDVSKMESLPKVEPFRAAVEIPPGMKVGFVVGYHHLEKPWGRIFMDMFQKQIEFDPEQIEFILIKNQDIPTGENSPASEREIQTAVQERGITHLIDIHEQLAMLNHYMDSHFEPKWRSDGVKNPNGKEYTLDPFVPTWMIEQYYQGNVYPQLQHAVNDQLSKVVGLIQNPKQKTNL